MKKLNRFNKSNKKRNFLIIGAFFLVSLLIVGLSYAVYQKEDEVRFINAKVGEFETSSSDIELAMTLDGENITTPPNKNDGYYNVIVDCDYANGSWNMEEWGADIRNITSNRVKCNVNFETLDVLATKVELGDYISMTPTSTSYTIPTSLTGYSSNQTINPSELNLWRVIKKNDDGTVEVVSEYVSSKEVYIRGQAGWFNMVGTLNTIASQYANEKYVESTRHMGYNNQKEKCTSLFTCQNYEGYEKDTNLIENLGIVKGKYLNGQSATYWIAARGELLYTSYIACYCVYYNKQEGKIVGGSWIYDTLGNTNEWKASIRPILTLKKDVKIVSGDGKSAATAYTFE